MYKDEYFPKFLVDKLADIQRETVSCIEDEPRSNDEIQEEPDKAVMKRNGM